MCTTDLTVNCKFNIVWEKMKIYIIYSSLSSALIIKMQNPQDLLKQSQLADHKYLFWVQSEGVTGEGSVYMPNR